MSDIKQALQQMPELTKEIGFILIDFYETMKSLEKDNEKRGKQATCIVMAVNDIKTIITK